MKRVYGVVLAVAAMVLTAVPAFAEFTFSVPTIAADEVGTMATSILAALALIWGVRKAIKMINRS